MLWFWEILDSLQLASFLHILSILNLQVLISIRILLRYILIKVCLRWRRNSRRVNLCLDILWSLWDVKLHIMMRKKILRSRIWLILLQGWLLMLSLARNWRGREMRTIWRSLVLSNMLCLNLLWVLSNWRLYCRISCRFGCWGWSRCTCLMLFQIRPTDVVMQFWYWSLR